MFCGWGSMLGYFSYFAANVCNFVCNQLKESGLLPKLRSLEEPIVMIMIVAFLGFAARREALRKQRLKNEKVTEKTESDSLLRKLLY